MIYQSWMLPEGVCESLIDDTKKIDYLEDLANNIFTNWGYQRLRPPMMEYLDALVTGADDILFDQTIQFKDQVSGKQLAIRADITPQITRIDKHYLKTDKITRYAYSGEVLRSYPAGHGILRNPTIAGLELFGSSCWEADAEIMMVLLSFLSKAQVVDFVLDLGNVDVAADVLKGLGVNQNHFASFFEALRIKDIEKLHELCNLNNLNDVDIYSVISLTTLNGDESILDKAKSLYTKFSDVLQSIARIENVVKLLKKFSPQTNINIDLGDVDGYAYHNGLTFSVFKTGVWQPLARGGRYDYFCNNEYNRSATGFSCNLNLLSSIIDLPNTSKKIISYDLPITPELIRFIDELRSNNIVIYSFDDGQSILDATHLIKIDDEKGYYVEEIK